MCSALRLLRNLSVLYECRHFVDIDHIAFQTSLEINVCAAYSTAQTTSP